MLLRITRLLKLEGVLARHLVGLLERECAKHGNLSGLVLDLSGVSLVDRAGIDALRRLHGTGVLIRGCSEAVACILEAEGVEVDRSAAVR
jgi:anti-anti-sigma regulatory factor